MKTFRQIDTWQNQMLLTHSTENPTVMEMNCAENSLCRLSKQWTLTTMALVVTIFLPQNVYNYLGKWYLVSKIVRLLNPLHYLCFDRLIFYFIEIRSRKLGDHEPAKNGSASNCWGTCGLAYRLNARVERIGIEHVCLELTSIERNQVKLDKYASILACTSSDFFKYSNEWW